MNDLQKLDRQYFWETRPKVVLTELQKYFDHVQDVTYMNDSAPSLEINERYYLFMPTSTRTNHDNEEYNYYMIVESENYGTDALTIECDTLDKVIDELYQIIAL
jgi:hypothetical protein